MRKIHVLTIVALGVGQLGCDQKITAPGVCPQFCPSSGIAVQETLLTEVVLSDTSYSGYLDGFEGITVHVAGGGTGVSYGVFRFEKFGNKMPFDNNINVPIDSGGGRMDSLRLEVKLSDWDANVPGAELVLHRLPVSVGQNSTFAELLPFFSDSTVIGSVALPDTVLPDSVITDTLSIVFLPSDVPNFVADSFEIAVGLSVRAPSQAHTRLFAWESDRGPVMRRFATIVNYDSAGAFVERNDNRVAKFDTHIFPDFAGPGQPQTLEIGGDPVSRAFLKMTLPDVILDSSQVISATLLLVPTEPLAGIPTDTINFVAGALGADFGAKSPLLFSPNDLALSATPLAVGSSDTLALNVTNVIALWQSNSNRVRSMAIVMQREGGSVGVLRVGSVTHPTLKPTLRLIYVPPFEFLR